MIPAGTAVACLLVFALFVCVVILDGIHAGEYRPRRLHRPHLPRRAARLAPEDAAVVAWVRELRPRPTWTTAMLRARLTVLHHVISQAQIPPTETPDPQPQLDYDETCESWDAVRTAALAAMLAADGDDS